MSHTRGPWKTITLDDIVYINPDRGEQGEFALIARMTGPDTTWREANARLIAAAPEMLEALILAEEALDILEQAEEPLAQPSGTLEKIREIILRAAGSLDEG